MEQLKELWRRAQGKRTMAFNLLLALFGVLELFDFTRIVDNHQTAGLITLIVALIGVTLRFQTTTAVGQRHD
jgi:hypothetical protein